jgi:hypothetical protein
MRSRFLQLTILAVVLLSLVQMATSQATVEATVGNCGNYPNSGTSGYIELTSYGDRWFCEWIIRAPDSEIRVWIAWIDTENAYDWVRGFDSSGSQVLYASGSTAGFDTYFFQNYVKVRFIADSSEVQRGFKVEWLALSKLTPCAPGFTGPNGGPCTALTPQSTLCLNVTNVWFPRTASSVDESRSWQDGNFTVRIYSPEPANHADFPKNDIDKLFNLKISDDDYFVSPSGLFSMINNYNNIIHCACAYQGPHRFQGISGWSIGIDMGRLILPKSMRIAARKPIPCLIRGRAPGKFRVYASDHSNSWTDNIHSSWTEIYRNDDMQSNDEGATWPPAKINGTCGDAQYKEFTFVNIFKNYQYFTLLVTHKSSAAEDQGLNFAEWNIFGDEATCLLTTSSTTPAQTTSFTTPAPTTSTTPAPTTSTRERVLFIGTEFSILYTSMHSPA